MHARGEIPCFRSDPRPKLESARVIFDYLGNAVAVVGVVIGVTVLFRCRLGRAWLGFTLWWSRRNPGFALWSLARGVSIMVAEGFSEAGATAVVVFLEKLFFLFT